MPAEIFRIPNLLSLSRIGLAPFICYGLSRDDGTGTAIAVALLILAGITDGLDGYFARRYGQVTSLGIALDPVADKILAAWLVVCLILYRGLPVWLAGIVVGRDLLILIFGLLLLRRRHLPLPSNIAGKYAFGAVVVLIGSYVIRFEFGILLSTAVALALIALSLIGYAFVFVRACRGESMPSGRDRRSLRILRIALSLTLGAVYVVKLFLEVIS